MLNPHYISTRPAMLASRYILSATFWTVLWKGLDRENLPSLSFQFCIHFLLCCIHVHSFPFNLLSVSIHVLWFCIHFLLISICFLSFVLHLLPFWAFISFHFASVSFLSLTPDMAIENGNRVFYAQFLQPISLKESRKVPSVFALFMNIAIKKMHRKWCWQWCMWINVCACVQCCAIFYVHSQQPFSCKHIICINKYKYVPAVQVWIECVCFVRSYMIWTAHILSACR